MIDKNMLVCGKLYKPILPIVYFIGGNCLDILRSNDIVVFISVEKGNKINYWKFIYKDKIVVVIIDKNKIISHLFERIT